MIRTVTVETGIVKGIPAADPRITAYLGIPFAAPPVGKNRWRAPQPAESWEGILDACRFGPIAMQVPPATGDMNVYRREWNVDPDLPMSEDCLQLNVWTPALDAGEKLPVFVWYFGGGLQVGHPAEMEFNGERIARRGIVVVTVNYRLNAFGFLAHPEITAENPDFPANFGNLDQKFGTEWVKRNIAAFGGDPNNITIGGQSAGGGSVLAQVASPLNEGLFQKAIVQSGIVLGPYVNMFPNRLGGLADAEKIGEDFFRFLGVKTLAEARALDAFYIRDKMLEYNFFWGTVPDGHYLVDEVMTSLLKNKRQVVPMLMGRTTNEFPSVPGQDTIEAFSEMVRSRYGSRAEAILAACSAENIDELKTKGTFSPIELGIRTLYQRTAELENAPENYYYVFDAEIPGWDNPGCFHSVDLWFSFETLAVCWRPFVGKHYDLARQMCNYFCNFIKSGNPNGLDTDESPMPDWLPYSAGGLPMVFGNTSAMGDETSETELMKLLVAHHLEHGV